MTKQSSHVAYRFRLYPTPEQATTLVRWQDSQRALWNYANQQRLERLGRSDGYTSRGKHRWISAYDQHAELTECRAEFEWVRDVPQMMQCDLLSQLDIGWRRFFERISGRPGFKGKKRCDWAPMGVRARECYRLTRKWLRFPKLGDLRMVAHRRIIGKPLHISITMDSDQWFVSISCEVRGNAAVTQPSGQAVGLDFGVENLISDSNGWVEKSPQHLAEAKTLIVQAQRVAARRKSGRGGRPSNNRIKANLRVTKIHQKVRRQRADFLHILSHHYANNHSTVVIEDLRVGNMTKSAKGTKEKAGKNVRQKAGLNREIRGCGWYELRRQLDYKCERTGAKLIVVDPKYTSQKCQYCGEADPKSRVTQMLFMCTSCGMIDHADVNAAKNILDRGIGPAGTTTVAVCGGSASRRPKKQKENRVSELRKGIAKGDGMLAKPLITIGCVQ